MSHFSTHAPGQRFFVADVPNPRGARLFAVTDGYHGREVGEPYYDKAAAVAAAARMERMHNAAPGEDDYIDVADCDYYD